MVNQLIQSIYKSHSQSPDRSVNKWVSPSFAAVATKQTTRTKKEMNCRRCHSLPHVPCGTVCGASRHGEGRRAGQGGGTYYRVVETTQEAEQEDSFSFTFPLLSSTRHERRKPLQGWWWCYTGGNTKGLLPP